MKESWRKTGIAPAGYNIVPPDGKWGWVVLVGCLICGYVGVAINISLGVIMNDLIDEFQTNAATISWITSVLSGVSGILGPFCTVMVNLFSCRLTVIIGGLCCSVGLILTSFANRIEIMLVTMGILTGIGCCLVFVSLQVVLACYFRKYYGIAMGILASGYATSKVTTTPMIQVLLDYYGWRGTLFIVGGFMLNIIIGGALFQPPNWHAVLQPIAPKDAETGEAVELKNGKITENKNTIADEIPYIEESEPIDTRAEFKTELEKKLAARVLLMQTSVPDENRELELMSFQRNRSLSAVCGSSLELNGPLSAEILKMSQEEKEPETTEYKKSNGWKEKILNSIDITLLRESRFYVVVIHYSFLITTMVYSTLFLYPFGIEKQLLPMESAVLVSARSIGEIIGRTAGPVIITTLKLPTLPSFVLSISGSAALFITQSKMTSLISLYSVSALCGLVFGGASGLNSIILLEVMGAKRLPSVLGICTLFQGFVVLGMGPLIGWMRDATGTYSSCFVLLGGIQFTMALMWILNIFLHRNTNKNNST